MGPIPDRRPSAPALSAGRATRGGAASGWERWPGPGGVAIDVLVAREPGARFHLHWHEEWSLGLVESGACTFACAGRRATARRGEVVLIPPRAVHAAGTGTGRFAMKMVYVPVPFAAAHLGLGPALVPRLARHVWRDPTAARALASATRRRDPLAALAVLARAVEACRARPPAADPLAPVDERVARVARALGGATPAVGVGELAAQVGLSREHLHRLFRAELGMTPGLYLRLARIGEARVRLARGEPAAEVAHACGFADQAHFSRWFRRYLGVTPGAFAAGIRGSGAAPRDSVRPRRREG